MSLSFYNVCTSLHIMWPDYDPMLMGNDDMCDCNGVFGEGCIEGEGDCDSDDQCIQAASDDKINPYG